MRNDFLSAIIEEVTMSRPILSLFQHKRCLYLVIVKQRDKSKHSGVALESHVVINNAHYESVEDGNIICDQLHL